MAVEVAAHNQGYAVGLCDQRTENRQYGTCLLVASAGILPCYNLFFAEVHGSEARVGQVMYPCVEKSYRRAVHIYFHTSEIEGGDAVGESVGFYNGVAAVDAQIVGNQSVVESQGVGHLC